MPGPPITSRRIDAGPDAAPAPVAPREARVPKLGVGLLGTLHLPGGTGVWMATGDADWDDLIDAENAGAGGGPGAGSLLVRMAESGRARKYPNGTVVRVEKMGWISLFVEVVRGEDRGMSGWVQREFVKPMPRSVEDEPSMSPDEAIRDVTGRIDRDRARENQSRGRAAADRARHTREAKEDETARVDRAATMLRSAGDLEDEGKPDIALALYRKIAGDFPGTPAARAAFARIRAIVRGEGR